MNLVRTLSSLVAVLLLAGCARPQPPAPGRDAAPAQAAAPAKLAPDDVTRLPPDDVRTRVQAGAALLVCAYEDDAKYQGVKLEGSISMHELEGRAASLGKGQALVFYCA